MTCYNVPEEQQATYHGLEDLIAEEITAQRALDEASNAPRLHTEEGIRKWAQMIVAQIDYAFDIGHLARRPKRQ